MLDILPSWEDTLASRKKLLPVRIMNSASMTDKNIMNSIGMNNVSCE